MKTCYYDDHLPYRYVYTCDCTLSWKNNVPYSQKIWRGIKFNWRFGSLACDRHIKICQYFMLAYIHMAIPFQTAKFKSVNIFTMAI